MFTIVLDEVDSHCPELRMNVTPEQHKALIDAIFPILSVESDPLFGAAKATLGDKVFDSSQTSFQYSVTQLDNNGTMDLPVAIGSMYVHSDKNDRSLSLNLTVLRGYSSRIGIHPASVEIELHISDPDVKIAFEGIYKDYRAQVCRLLEQADIEFFTSYCSEIVGKSKSKKLSAKLDEYFSDQEVDNCFTLVKSCPRGTEYSTGIRAFLALTIVYTACRGALASKAWRSSFEKNLFRFGC